MPLPCNIVKLMDVEEMNYFASNGEGEVRCSTKVLLILQLEVKRVKVFDTKLISLNMCS